MIIVALDWGKKNQNILEKSIPASSYCDYIIMRHDHPYADANLRNQLFDLLLHNMQTTQSGEQGTEIASQTQKECRCFTLAVHASRCFRRCSHCEYCQYDSMIYVQDCCYIPWRETHTLRLNWPLGGGLMLNDRMLQPGLTTKLGWTWTSANLETPTKTWHPWCGSNHSRRSFSENTIWRNIMQS